MTRATLHDILASLALLTLIAMYAVLLVSL